ncbi:TIGR02452 family protein [Streptomyces corynorhini]|uniref:TIGR02452 family protein n=1 Tax=Streptomyces corynorhini TaxID=2282652 RepID=A0A370B5V6_9ACTN|nr:TIGR02452 family protein [Streptomyces corynorhini]RDG35136.1 TIGR02452 family protein [Streptomyces corynorhini]
MSARLRGIAKETEEIVRTGGYRTADGRDIDLRRAVDAAVAGTRMYGPGPVAPPPRERGTHPRAARAEATVEVTGESSLDAARRLTETGPGAVAVLNFASARNPGGGYLNGAQAQEEALCRGSALYATLRRAPEFYAHHRAEPSPFYSDRVIHSPGVPVFRDDRGRLLDTPYEAGFLTAAAPNAGVIARNLPGEVPLIASALAARAERVLETAAGRGYRRLVLGAWGCGVFRNDPATVAGSFAALLTGGGRFADRFDEAVFAVLDRTPEQATLMAFRRVLES